MKAFLAMFAFSRHGHPLLAATAPAATPDCDTCTGQDTYAARDIGHHPCDNQ